VRKNMPNLSAGNKEKKKKTEIEKRWSRQRRRRGKNERKRGGARGQTTQIRERGKRLKHGVEGHVSNPLGNVTKTKVGKLRRIFAKKKNFTAQVSNLTEKAKKLRKNKPAFKKKKRLRSWCQNTSDPEVTPEGGGTFCVQQDHGQKKEKKENQEREIDSTTNRRLVAGPTKRKYVKAGC